MQFVKQGFSGTLLGLGSLVLVACGGGGGSDDEPSTSGGGGGTQQEEVVVERVSLTGLAVKGKISGAEVNFFLVDSETGLLDDTPFASTVTRSDGSYEMKSPEITSYQGPVAVEIIHKDGATIECDFAAGCDVDNDGAINVDASSDVAFGENYPLPTDFKMRAIAANIKTSNFGTQQFRVNITPLTEGAAALALTKDALTADEVNQSNNQIRALVKLPADVNLINTSPQALNENPEQTGGAVEYALVISAFEGMSQDLAQSVDDTIEQFVQQLTDNNGQLLFNNKDAADTNKISLARLVEQAGSAANTLGLTTLSSQYNTLNTDYVAEPSGGFSSVAPPTVMLGAVPAEVNAQASVSIAVTTNAPSVTYQWTQVEGSPVVLNNDSTADVSFTAPSVEGPVVVRIVVTDTVTQQSGVGYAKVNVKVAASTDPVNSVTGNYSLLLIGQVFNINRQFAFSEVGFNSSHMKNLSVTGSSLNSLSLNNTGVSNNFGQFQSWNDGSITGHSIRKETDSDAFVIPSSLNANHIFQVNIPAYQNLDVEDDQWELEPARQVNLFPMGVGNYVGILPQVFEKYENLNNQPNLSNLQEVELSTELMVLTRDDAHLSSAIPGTYGMVNLSQRFDQNGQYIMSSELSENVLSTPVAPNAILETNTTAADRDVEAMPSVSTIVEGSLVAAHYDTSSTPNLHVTPLDAHPSFTSQVSNSFQYLINSSGELSVPEAFDDTQTIGFRGQFGNELLYTSAYAYQGDNVATATWSQQRMSLGIRKPDVAISTTLAAGAQYQVQGIVYKIRGCCQQLESEIIKNATFTMDTSTVSIAGLFEFTRLNLIDDSVSHANHTETNAQMPYTLHTSGVVVIDGGDVKMEGFMSEDGSQMILRFKGESTDVNDKYSEQGIMIATKIN